MAPITPVTLTGRHIRLEPMTRAHLDALAAIAFEGDLFRWYTITMRTRDELAEWLEVALAAHAAGTALPFVTVHLGDNRIVGATRYLNSSQRDGRYEIGSTWVAKPWQRTPVNTEAKYLMLRHAFEGMGAHRVEFKTHVNNVQSRRAIERIGGTFEGIHRKHMLMTDGSMRDSVWYSIIDDEWPTVKARLESRLAAQPAVVA
jgi:RimJ/RimL family protein N-acetyltransferase